MTQVNNNAAAILLTINSLKLSGFAKISKNSLKKNIFDIFNNVLEILFYSLEILFVLLISFTILLSIFLIVGSINRFIKVLLPKSRKIIIR